MNLNFERWLEVDFTKSMTIIEERAWLAFVKVVNHFLANKQTKNYREKVNEVLSSFELFGRNMSIKGHFLFSVIDEQENAFIKTLRLWKNTIKGAGICT